MTDSDLVVDCRTCGEPIPADASRCPNCDARVATKPWGIGMIVFGLAIAGLFAVGGLTAFFPLENWPAGSVAGLFVSVLGVRLYRIRERKLENARPQDAKNT